MRVRAQQAHAADAFGPSRCVFRSRPLAFGAADRQTLGREAVTQAREKADHIRFSSQSKRMRAKHR